MGRFSRHLVRTICKESTLNIINDSIVTVGALKSLDYLLSIAIFTSVVSLEKSDDDGDVKVVVQGSCKKLLDP